jgi:hypothetical protein
VEWSGVELSGYTAVYGGEVKGKSRSQGCGGHENEVPGMRQRVQIVRSYGCIGQYGTVRVQVSKHHHM